MRYEYLNYSKYNINNIYDAFEHETRANFFNICKMQKFTLNPYPGKHKYASKLEELDKWLEDKLSHEESVVWEKILAESRCINMLYEDLYNDPYYKEANSIESSKELSAFLICIEYVLSAIRGSSIGEDDLSNQLGLELGTEDDLKDINHRLCLCGEFFDNISVKVKDILEYLMYEKNSAYICENIDKADVMKARGHILSVLKKTAIDLLAESWQFGGVEISLEGNEVTGTNDFWEHIMRTYWEIRERSNTTVQTMAFEKFPIKEPDEKQDIMRTQYILQKQLYIDNMKYSCKISKKGREVEFSIHDFVKGYARLKSICQNHLKGRDISNISGNINAVCVRIGQDEIKNQFKEIQIEDPDLILDLLTYDRGKDIIDAPLIPYMEYFYIIPTLIGAVNIAEVIFSVANVFDIRGEELEKKFLDILREEHIMCGKFTKHRNADTYQCDSWFIIDDSLFLVEAKAWGFPNSITRYYRMNQKILGAEKQIERLANYVHENLSEVLESFGLNNDYKIENIYQIILTNFQRADEQKLKNTFICDFNTFKGFIKDIPCGILVQDITSGSTIKIINKPVRGSRLTVQNVLDYLNCNEMLENTSRLLIEEEFCEFINTLKLKEKILKRKCGLFVVEDAGLVDILT